MYNLFSTCYARLQLQTIVGNYVMCTMTMHDTIIHYILITFTLFYGNIRFHENFRIICVFYLKLFVGLIWFKRFLYKSNINNCLFSFIFQNLITSIDITEINGSNIRKKWSCTWDNCGQLWTLKFCNYFYAILIFSQVSPSSITSLSASSKS